MRRLAARALLGVTVPLLLAACVGVDRQPPPLVVQPVEPSPATAVNAPPTTQPRPHAPVVAPAPTDAAATTPSTPLPPPPNAPVGVAPRGAVLVGAMSAASQVLLAQSRQLLMAGDLSAASDDLERALRIDPGQPVLWLELGEVRLQAGDRTQAKSNAQRANLLGGKDPVIQARAENLLLRAAR